MTSDSTRVVVIGLALAGVVGGGLFWWKRQQKPPAPPPAVAVAPQQTPPPVKPLPPPPPEEPAIEHPIGKASGHETLPALDQTDGLVRGALNELLGKRLVQQFLVSEGLLRKFVATVDNLGRDNAPSGMWPVVPTAGRFVPQSSAHGTFLGEVNQARYTVFVTLVTSIDAGRAVGLYRRLYPLLQQAYEELGYPGKYFNDRVVAVIDNLEATPDPKGPISVKGVEVPGAPAGKMPSLYLFEDPALEARSAGQKVLLRMGHQNATRVKAKLAEVRKLLARDFAAGR